MRFSRSSFLLLSSITGATTAQMSRGNNLIKLPNVTAIHNLNEQVESRLPNGIAPTDAPTSLMPSDSPSMAPSAMPSDTPSSYPSQIPTISPYSALCLEVENKKLNAWCIAAYAMGCDDINNNEQACQHMEDLYRDNGGGFPIWRTSPSPSVSMAPSAAPSDNPSASPSDKPSSMPSFAPSYSPTQETQKTKASVNEVVLQNIPREMDDMTLARFEIATLEFMRQAQPPTKGYEVEILAVTVLAQTVVFPDHYETHPSVPKDYITENDPQRSLVENGQQLTNSKNSPWDVALQVKFRVVAVVTDGRVPIDFDLADLSMYGMEHNLDQYLWQLGNSNDFFAPLKDISDWPAQQEAIAAANGENNKSTRTTGFVFVLLFSLIALGLAVFASWYAIRRHVNRNNRRRRKSRKSKGHSFSPKQKTEYSGEEIINYLTNSTNEDSTYHDGDLEGGGAIHFVKSIDSDDQSMESVGLTPKSARSIGSGFFEGDDTSPLKSPVKMNSPKKDTAAASSNVSFGLTSAKKKMKKWMTPRQSIENSNNADTSNNRFSVGSKSVRFDPPEKDSGAGRSTTPRQQSEPEAKKGGIYSQEDGLEVVKNATGDDGEFTLPISFFSGSGDDADSDFMGGRSPMSSLAGSNASSFFSNVGKTFGGRRSSTGRPSLNGIPTNPTIKENYAFSEATAKYSAAPSTVVNNLRNTKQAIMSANMPKKAKPGSEVSDNSQSSRVQDLAKQYLQRQQEANKMLSPHPAPRTKPFNDPREGFEQILGARSRSMEEDDVVQNMAPDSQLQGHQFMKAPSSTPKNRKTYGYHFNQPDDNKKQSAPADQPASLGAKPMDSFDDQKDERDDRSTLSAVMQRQGTYDVYAPSGPIGIVVDTSKQGPSVHSLKSTSPMLGLITAGDLIIALDGEDTRGLSAAELTRLMAKKSRQRERKITLYSVDGF